MSSLYPLLIPVLVVVGAQVIAYAGAWGGWLAAWAKHRVAVRVETARFHRDVREWVDKTTGEVHR